MKCRWQMIISSRMPKVSIDVSLLSVGSNQLVKDVSLEKYCLRRKLRNKRLLFMSTSSSLRIGLHVCPVWIEVATTFLTRRHRKRRPRLQNAELTTMGRYESKQTFFMKETTEQMQCTWPELSISICSTHAYGRLKHRTPLLTTPLHLKRPPPKLARNGGSRGSGTLASFPHGFHMIRKLRKLSPRRKSPLTESQSDRSQTMKTSHSRP